MLYLVGLGSADIYIVDEARNAQAAWEMWQRGDWVLPTFNGDLRAHKPPLHYYGMWIGYAAFGKTALAARLGSALCGITVTSILAFQAAKMGGRNAAIATALVFCSMFYVGFQFRLATPDAYLTLCFVGSMFFLYQGFHAQKSLLLWGGYALLGIGVLAKGPVIVALAALSFLAYLLVLRLPFTKWWRRMRPLSGALIVVLLASPWFWAVHEASDGNFTRSFFIEHNVDRFLSTKEGHGGGPWLIPLIVLVCAMPWIFWLRTALGRLNCWARTEHPLLLFSLITSLVVILFFALSQTKLPSYPFPALPFIALMIGLYFGQVFDGHLPVVARYPAVLLGLLSLGIGIIAYCPISIPGASTSTTKELQLPLSLIGGTGLLACILWWYRRFRIGFYAVLTMSLTLQLFVLNVAMPKLVSQSQIQGSRSILLAAPAIYALYQFAPAYVFSLDRPINAARTVPQLRGFLSTAPGGSLILSRERYRDSFPTDLPLLEVFRQKDLFEYPTTIIYEYRPGNEEVN